MIERDIEKINKDLLGKVDLAQLILNKIRANPQLVHVQDPSLSKLKDSRWNGHFVFNILDEIITSYGANCYNNIICNQDIPGKIKEFFKEAYNYRFGS